MAQIPWCTSVQNLVPKLRLLIPVIIIIITIIIIIIIIIIGFI